MCVVLTFTKIVGGLVFLLNGRKNRRFLCKFALPISVMVTTAGNGARFCATSAPKIGPRKCFTLTLR